MKLMERAFGTGGKVGVNDQITAERTEITRSFTDDELIATIAAFTQISNGASEMAGDAMIPLPAVLVEAACDYYIIALIAECQRRDELREGRSDEG